MSLRASLARRSLQQAGRRHRCYSDKARIRITLAPNQGDSSSSKSHTGSTKLFSDARQEDLSGTSTCPKSTQLQVLESQAQHANWDGEERMQDAVLRMLVDKYKPLRRGNGSGSGIESADEKLKRDIPRVTARSPGHSSWEDVGNRLEPFQWATEPLLSSTKDHKPWHTTFKVPSHVEGSIKLASLSTAMPTSTRPESSSSTSPNGIQDDKTRRLEREATKRTEHAGRLTRARESTLDYKMGITPEMKNLNRVAGQGQSGRTNPITVKGWASLVEDQIEVG
jgi:DnaJ family protein C protein 28